MFVCCFLELPGEFSGNRPVETLLLWISRSAFICCAFFQVYFPPDML